MEDHDCNFLYSSWYFHQLHLAGGAFLLLAEDEKVQLETGTGTADGVYLNRGGCPVYLLPLR